MAWTFDRSKIFKSSLRKVGAIAEGEDPDADKTAQCKDALTIIIDDLGANDGVRLWNKVWITQTMTASSEVDGTDGEVYTCIKSHTSSSSNKPVTGADYTTYWRKRGDTGGVWADSTAYTSVSDFTLDADVLQVEQAFSRDTNHSDSELLLINGNRWADISDKTSQGSPSDLLYIEETISSEDTALKCHLYHMPNRTTDVIHLLVAKSLTRPSGPGDVPDVPKRWYRYLIWKLAADLAPEYGHTITYQRNYESLADKEKEKAMVGDQDYSESDFIDSIY